MKLTDNYTKEDIDAINCMMFYTAMIMFAMAVIAQVVGIL